MKFIKIYSNIHIIASATLTADFVLFLVTMHSDYMVACTQHTKGERCYDVIRNMSNNKAYRKHA